MELLKDLKQIEYRTQIPAFLKKHNLNNNIAEIGVRFGYNFQQLISCKPKLAFAIDHYRCTDNPAEQDTNLTQEQLNKIYADVFKRFLYNSAVRVIRENSLKALAFFEPYSLDYVYVDADHSYKGALRDIEHWWNKVRQGGILAGHDYIETEAKNGVEFGVIKAVKKFCNDKKIDMNKYFHNTKHGYKSWLIYKNDGE